MVSIIRMPDILCQFSTANPRKWLSIRNQKSVGWNQTFHRVLGEWTSNHFELRRKSTIATGVGNVAQSFVVVGPVPPPPILRRDLSEGGGLKANGCHRPVGFNWSTLWGSTDDLVAGKFWNYSPGCAHCLWNGILLVIELQTAFENWSAFSKKDTAVMLQNAKSA